MAPEWGERRRVSPPDRRVGPLPRPDAFWEVGGRVCTDSSKNSWCWGHHNELISHLLESGSLEKSTPIQKIKGSPFRRVIFTFCVKLKKNAQTHALDSENHLLCSQSWFKDSYRRRQTEADGRHAACDTSGSGLTAVAALHIMKTFPRSDALADTAGGRRFVFVRLQEPALTRCKCQQHPSKRRSARSADL